MDIDWLLMISVGSVCCLEMIVNKVIIKDSRIVKITDLFIIELRENLSSSRSVHCTPLISVSCDAFSVSIINTFGTNYYKLAPADLLTAKLCIFFLLVAHLEGTAAQ